MHRLMTAANCGICRTLKTFGLAFMASLITLWSLQALSAPKTMPHVLLNEAAIASLQQAIANKKEPTYSAFLQLQADVEADQQTETVIPKEFMVPGWYEKPEEHKAAAYSIRQDAHQAYGLALMYGMTGNTTYGNQAILLINSWMLGVKTFHAEGDSTLVLAGAMPNFIFAADLLRGANYWPGRTERMFRAFLRNDIYPLSPRYRQNNWANWGLLLSTSIAAYLGEQPLLQQLANEWKLLTRGQINSDGLFQLEVHRNNGESGIWYSHFALSPHVITAQILTEQGYPVLQSAEGAIVHHAYRNVIQWTKDPTTFPFYQGDTAQMTDVDYINYFELLQAIWPDPQAQALLQAHRPISTMRAASFLTFTHGQ